MGRLSNTHTVVSQRFNVLLNGGYDGLVTLHTYLSSLQSVLLLRLQKRVMSKNSTGRVCLVGLIG